MQVEEQQLAKAILHGWFACQPDYHFDFREMLKSIEGEVCDEEWCECKDEGALERMLTGVAL